MTETYAARLTRESGTSFYYAFRILPAERRDAIYALYSFCRAVDDCVDEADGDGEAGLVRWMAEVDRAYAGTPETPLGHDLARALSRFTIPRASFADIVEGCRMDLTVRRYATFGELRVYCERVASAVGLACIEVFGYTQPAARDYARELGLALQLTNILRDVAADAARGRLYLPLEDLGRFGVSEDELFEAVRAAPRAPVRLLPLLDFEAERARAHYRAAAALLPEADRRRLVSAEIMGAVYRAVLEAVVRRGYPLAAGRVSLSRAHKLWILARTLWRGRAA